MHQIETEAGETRQFWDCSCGRSGSCSIFADVEAAAERHVGDDESRSFRHL